MFKNAGQMCWAGSRLFGHESIRAEFLRTLVRATADFRLGPGSEEATQMGPLVSRDQERSVIEYIEGGGRGGARGLIGGHQGNLGKVGGGDFVGPPVFDEGPGGGLIAPGGVFRPGACAVGFGSEGDG